MVLLRNESMQGIISSDRKRVTFYSVHGHLTRVFFFFFKENSLVLINNKCYTRSLNRV